MNKTTLNIDKGNWKLTRLGDLATEISKRIDDPYQSGINRFVGLQHFISGNLIINNWGETDGLASSTKAFEKGDILFARRNAYLRRASLVDFDGVCSGDAFVLKENHDKIVPGFLAFIVNSNSLWDFANSNAAGTMSKRVKWRDLAEYKFLLPPKDQQKKIAELLWAMDEVIEKDLKVLEKLELLLNSSIEETIHGEKMYGKTIKNVLNDLTRKKEVKPLVDFGIFLKGKGIPKSAVVPSGIPCVRYGELYTRHHRVIREYYSHIDNNSALEGVKLRQNDVLFAGSGETIDEIGKSAGFINDDIVYAGGDILIFRPNDMDGTYLGYLMNSLLIRHQLNRYGTGATVIHIYQSDLKKLKLPVYNKESQVRMSESFEKISNNIKDLEIKINSSKSLQKSLLNQIF